MEGYLSINDAAYPALLKGIKDPPKGLYYIGNLSEENLIDCVSFVGSRKMSPYGKKVVEHLLGTLSSKIAVVSGFTYGVDMEVHLNALANNLRTVAAIPYSIDKIPDHLIDVANRVVDTGGAILSEYPPGFYARSWSFVKRNRIIAGLSKLTVVIEAAEESGSLITADLANKYSRKVLAVPGNIFSPQSAGCCKLLLTYADVVCSGTQINQMMGEGHGYGNGGIVSNVQETVVSDPLLDLLKTGPYTLDEISSYLAVSIPTLSTKLTQYCVKGLIIEYLGKFYAG